MDDQIKKQKQFEISRLHEQHPKIRAKDWSSPLVRRLLKSGKYEDGTCDLEQSFRPPDAKRPVAEKLLLCWSGLKSDFEQIIKTYQDPVITEFATLGLACI